MDIHLPDYPCPLVLAVSVASLILSEANNVYSGSAGFKITASLSFLGAGVHSAVTKLDFTNWEGQLHWEQRSSVILVLGLTFSVIGDVLLIPSSKVYHHKFVNLSPPTNEGESPRFKGGIAFFALAHIAYIAAFLSDPTSHEIRWPDFIGAYTFGAVLTYWLGLLNQNTSPNAWFNVPKEMRGLVIGYVAIIMTMVATATSTDSGHQRTVGAWTFMISDLFVAADVFGVKKDGHIDGRGRRGWRPRSIGWVAYFGAQLLLAGCI